MKCPEVIEWMHRYIDGDLNEEESDVLFQHVRTCSDCAEEFEMLKMLSARLEDLPKVTPNYSLVDSILPQLDAIDRARREEGSTVEMIPGMIPAASNDNELSRKSRRPQTSRRKRTYVSGALGLAAALILGVFIYQYEPFTMSDAEIAISSNEESTSNDTGSAAADKAESTTAAQDTSTPSTDSSNVGDNNKAEEAGSQELQEAQEGTNQELSDSGGGSMFDNDKATDGGDKKMPATSEPSLSPVNSGDKSAKQYDAAPDVNSGPDSNAQQLPPANNKGTGTNADAGNNQDKSTESAAVPSDNPLEGPIEDTLMMGFARFTDIHEWTSPDGKYIVDKQKELLSLYQINENNEINENTESTERMLISEVPIDGEWVIGGWSEDGKEFLYEIVKDGVPTIHTITPYEDRPKSIFTEKKRIYRE